MKGGRCSNCSCGKKTESFAGYGLKLGGSSCGRNHKGGSSCGMNHKGGGAHKMNHKGGDAHKMNHKGGSSCGIKHKGGFIATYQVKGSETLQAVPKTNQKGGGKSKRKLQSNKRKRKLRTRRNKKLRGGSIKCPAFYFDLNDQMKGLAVVKRRESCRSS